MQCQIGFHIQCQITFRPPVKGLTRILTILLGHNFLPASVFANSDPRPVSLFYRKKLGRYSRGVAAISKVVSLCFVVAKMCDRGGAGSEIHVNN